MYTKEFIKKYKMDGLEFSLENVCISFESGSEVFFSLDVKKSYWIFDANQMKS